MKQETVEALKASSTELQLLVEKAEGEKDDKTLVIGRALKAICEAIIEVGESLKSKTR